LPKRDLRVSTENSEEPFFTTGGDKQIEKKRKR
jgi:hypothetical protein